MKSLSPLCDSIGEIQASKYKCLLKIVFCTWELNYVIISSNLINLKCQKRKHLLNHDSAKVFFGVSLIMCMHIFLFLFELNNYVTSFVVETIVVPFKYIDNKTSMIFTRCTTLKKLIKRLTIKIDDKIQVII